VLFIKSERDVMLGRGVFASESFPCPPSRKRLLHAAANNSSHSHSHTPCVITPPSTQRGLIMYRESRLLVDPKEGDMQQVRAVCAVPCYVCRVVLCVLCCVFRALYAVLCVPCSVCRASCAVLRVPCSER